MNFQQLQQILFLGIKRLHYFKKNKHPTHEKINNAKFKWKPLKTAHTDYSVKAVEALAGLNLDEETTNTHMYCFNKNPKEVMSKNLFNEQESLAFRLCSLVMLTTTCRFLCAFYGAWNWRVNHRKLNCGHTQKLPKLYISQRPFQSCSFSFCFCLVVQV